MSPLEIVILSVLGVLLLVILGLVLYFALSPMPLVKFLRRSFAGGLTYPDGYDEVKARTDIQNDLTYASKYGKNTLDLYIPKAEGKYPLILWVHGGAFVAGDKCGVENWCVMLADEGCAVAAMNYEWAPEAAYPAQLIQIAEALEELKRLAAESGKIDMSRVAIAGDSAGAHMASQFMLIHTNPRFAERMNIASPLADDALKCALLYCGPYDFERMLRLKNRILQLFVSRIGWSYLGKKNWKKSELIDTITPMDFVTEACIPAYITDGNNFSFEPHGRALGEALRKAGVETAERYFDKEKYGEVNHEYQMKLETENGKLCFEDTLEFLKAHGILN